MKTFKSIFIGILILVAGFSIIHAAIGEASPAEKLIACLPDDTLGAVAFSGSHALNVPFEQSHLGLFFADPGIQAYQYSLINSIKTLILKNANHGNPEEINATIVRGQALLSKLLEYPIVIGCGQNTDHDTLPVYLYAMIETSHDPAGFKDMINQIYEMAGFDEHSLTEFTTQFDFNGHTLTVFNKYENDHYPGRISFGRIGSRFIMSLEPEPGFTIQKLSVSNNQTLKSQLAAQAGNGDIGLIYLNTAAIRQFVCSLVSKAIKPEEFDKLQQAVTQLGLDQSGALISRIGFNHQDLTTDSSLALKMSGQGLTGLMKPINLDILNYVDDKVMDVNICNIDLHHLYRSLDQFIKTIADENDYQEFINGLADIEFQTGIDIESYISSISGPMMMAAYHIGAIPEVYNGGFSLVIDLNDAVNFEQSCMKLGGLIQSVVAKENQQMNLFIIQDQDINNRTYHNWTIPPLAMAQIMPCWTMVDNRFVLASNASLCQMTAEQISGERSVTAPLLKSKRFQKTTGTLPANLTSLRFTDSRQMLQNARNGLQMVLPMASMALSRQGISIPSVLPAIDHLIAGFEPTISYSWMDTNGIHSHSHGPMPTGDGPVLAGSAALGISILMPALGRARAVAKTVVCANQLKGIGIACIMYANDHSGHFPPDLFSLTGTVDLHPDHLICPSSSHQSGDCSYIYRGADLNDSHPANMIMAYDQIGNHPDGSRNVLYLDGHIVKMNNSELKQAIEKDNSLRKELNLNSMQAE